MDSLELIVDLHRDNPRQGPGGEAEFRQALTLAGLETRTSLEVADIGCGTGSSAIALARVLNARVTAVDFLGAFLETLEQRARDAGVADRIDTLKGSMDELPFEQSAFDLIWSEGAIYNMGFARGVTYWRQFLKPRGVLGVSEITWTTQSRPQEVDSYWRAAYPEIGTASEKFAVLESAGYSPIGYFTLGEHCWLDNYYHPLRDSTAQFLQRHQYSDDAVALVREGEEEQALYERFKAFYSYGFYIARKCE